ncbi:MAG: CPXCG motif-containing cysteine-rich protein [Nevskiales bacterium]|nr:CPXCG motif-containing cysteine-rich protein [Nevskiales bacterium]
MLEEAEVTCPSCWETIVLELDLSAGSAVYAEDCPVCCRPMTVTLTVDGDDYSVDVAAENE